MAQMKLSHFLSLLLLVISPSFSFAKISILPSRFASKQAEKLIRELNLFPKESDNIVDRDPFPITADDDDASRIVEKRFAFPNLANSSVSFEDLGHHAGYYKIKHSHAARLFYFFFESRGSKDDPVVIWLSGGPGCSSELALFYENGPFSISKNLSLVPNEYGWDKVSNLIYVDQPTGTGFSYSSDRRDLCHTETCVSDDLYDFIQAFFEEHPELVKNEFYITGESYAGHYIPAFAARVHKGNKGKEGTHINLKGFAIGNGLTDPKIQYPAYTDYALDMGLISKPDHDRINKLLPVCDVAINLCGTSCLLSFFPPYHLTHLGFPWGEKGVGDDPDINGWSCTHSKSILVLCFASQFLSVFLLLGTNGKISCLAAYFVCNSIFTSIRAIAGTDINHYDIRKKCEGRLCYDFSDMEKMLNLRSVKQALGVEDIEFVSCSTTVYQAMLVDWMRNLEVGIPTLLEDGIKLLVYAGEYDLICNWLGNSRWVQAMEWKGQKEFVASPEVPFEVNGSEAGLLRNHGPLSFLKVHDAGHMVPMDQPKAALEMLKRWTRGTLSQQTTEPENLVASM